MSHHLNYAELAWEAFEDLCTNLWFDEGYTNIKPYGRRNEGGRDAVFIDLATQDLTLFQYKRWTGHYDTSSIKSKIREAAKKVEHFSPKTFILNSPLEPNPVINDWISELGPQLGFAVIYCDRSWVDLRLDNRRQDLRWFYFKHHLEHHSLTSLVSATAFQVQQAVSGLASKFRQEVYIAREAEAVFDQFTQSDKTCLVIVDRSGRGKSNLLCSLAMKLREQSQPVVLIPGDISLIDDNSLERLVSASLGYTRTDGSNYVADLQDAADTLKREGKRCYALLDGISKSDDASRMRRALKNLLLRLAQLETFQLCLTCRDILWPSISSELPEHLLFSVSQLAGDTDLDKYAYQLSIGDFTDVELTQACSRYANEYNVVFTASGLAQSQLRHPLLLRVFCEAHRNQTLGEISAVPTSVTFDRYINQKANTIAMRIRNNVRPSDILNLLSKIAGRGWSIDAPNSLPESEIVTLLPATMTVDQARELLYLLEEEGVVAFREQPFVFERTIQFVFDELYDFFLLRHLITLLPPHVRTNPDITKNAGLMFNYYESAGKLSESVTLFSLVGMILPKVDQRRNFLTKLLKRDFATFCECLMRISPTDRSAYCDTKQLGLFGDHIRYWYGLIVSTYFEEARPMLDPQPRRNDSTQLGLEMVVSPECREISYGYTLKKATPLVNVTHVDRYPTLMLEITRGDESFKLHDPDNGLFVPIYRSGRDDVAWRVINSVHPPFPGFSFGVPERNALFDVWNEIEHVIKTKKLPWEMTDLLEERAWSIAVRLRDCVSVQNLTFEDVNAVLAQQLSQGEKTRLDLDRLSDLKELAHLLERINKPLGSPLLPQPDLLGCSELATFREADFSDAQLQEYLAKLFLYALPIFKMSTEKNFPKLAQLLYVYHQLPCAAVIITDRQCVKYTLLPVATVEDAKVECYVVDKDTIDVNDPDAQLLVNHKPVREYVLSELSKMNKLIRPAQIVDKVEPLKRFFSPTPISSLVEEWQLSSFSKLLRF